MELKKKRKPKLSGQELIKVKEQAKEAKMALKVEWKIADILRKHKAKKMLDNINED